jgi:hypothetical protein
MSNLYHVSVFVIFEKENIITGQICIVNLSALDNLYMGSRN